MSLVVEFDTNISDSVLKFTAPNVFGYHPLPGLPLSVATTACGMLSVKPISSPTSITIIKTHVAPYLKIRGLLTSLLTD